MPAWLNDNLVLVLLLGAGVIFAAVGSFLYDSRRVKQPDVDPLDSFGPPLELADWPPKDW